MKQLLFCFLLLTTISCQNNNVKKLPAQKTISSIWKGDWNRDEIDNQAALTINNIKGDSISFVLQASNGANSDETEGKAVVIGNAAKYIEIIGNDTLSLTFELMGDSLIQVGELSGEMSHALGVYYTGDYYNVNFHSKTKVQKTKEESSLVDLGTFATASDDSIFRALTRKDYNLFVSSTQLTTDQDDLDSLHAYVQSSAIRGLYSIMENIIMIDSSKNIWAAVLSDDTIYYYTNTQIYKNQLPKTIEKWKSGFDNHPVIYKSK